jgi:putative nucleotidyltransferase with HDIG domain
MFGLFSKKKSKAEELPALSSGLRTTINTFLGVRGVPPLPASAQRSFRLAVDPNASARDFIEAIESDEGISARIIKISNSVYFDRGVPSRNIEESVNKIGLNELRCILNANSLPELLPSHNQFRAQIWINDLATAIISRSLASTLAPAETNTAFLCGLMHDIGKLLLLQRDDVEYQKAIQLVKTTDYDFCRAEEEIFAFNHCELGQLMAEKWNFTPDIIAAIREHHKPWTDLAQKKGSASLAAIVKLADLIAHSQGLGHSMGFTGFRNRCEKQIDEGFNAISLPLNQKKGVIERCIKAYENDSDMYTFK